MTGIVIGISLESSARKASRAQQRDFGDYRSQNGRFGEYIFCEPIFETRADQWDQQKTPYLKKKRFEPFEHKPLFRGAPYCSSGKP